MQNALISRTGLRFSTVRLFLIVLVGGAGLLRATDFSLINQLPAKVASAREKSAKGWDTGVTSKMREASYDYNNILVELMNSLAVTYYKPEVLSPLAIDDFVKALYTTRRFQQNVTNPNDESLGSVAGLEILDGATEDLQKTLLDMVEAVVGDDPAFDAADWRKKWDAAVAQ